MNTHLKLLGVAILWGASWPWGRMVAQALPPMTAAAMRFALATLGLLIWLGYSEKGWHTVRALTPRQWLGLAIAAACGVFGYALFFMLGLQHVPAGRGAVVITMNPALTLLLAAWLFKERLNAAIILGMLLAIGGALTAITQGQVLQFFAGGFKSGEVLLLGCVICWAAYTLIGRALLPGIDALTATTITAAIGAVMLAAGSLLFEGARAWQHMAQTPASAWWALIALALATTTVAYAWYFDGVKVLGAGNAATYITLVPVFGVMISALWLHEPLPASLVLGGLVAVAGMALMQWGQMQARPSKKSRP